MLTTADTVQKTGLAGYQALGKQVQSHTGVQLPGAVGTQRSPVGSPAMERRESDYDDFWAENGIKDDSNKTPESAKFVGQQPQKTNPAPATSTASRNVDKDDEWENW